MASSRPPSESQGASAFSLVPPSPLSGPIRLTLTISRPMSSDTKPRGLMLDLSTKPQSPAVPSSDTVPRVKRAGTVKRDSSGSATPISQTQDSGYEAAREESPAKPRPAPQRYSGFAGVESTESLHSRFSSSDSIFPSKGYARSNSTGGHRSEYASCRPFPTPGVRDRRTSKASSAKSATGTASVASDDEEDAGVDMPTFKSAEEKRLDEDSVKAVHWKRWGPYCAERQWVSL